MASLLLHKQRYWKNDGSLNAGGKVYVYESGTSTPKTTYTTAAATVQHPHPIVLDSKGEANIFTTGTFKVNVTDSDDVQITGFPVDGLGDVLGSSIHSATAKTTPVDADEVSIWDSVSQVAQKVTWANVKATLLTTWKDATGGLVGMTLFKINFKNAANTFTSFFTNSNTAARTYTFQDRNGTIADDTDLATKAALAGSASQAFSTSTAAQGSNTTLAASTAFVINEFGKHRNRLVNGRFQVAQLLPSSCADDEYGHDQWYVLTQTGTIAVSTLTDVENTTPYMARLTQSQAAAQRFGYAQIIEGVGCKDLRGQAVTFKFRTRLSTSANIRIAVLEWTGTEDTVTSDVVNDWTSATYTAGNFFLAANLTVSAVTQQALTANTLTDSTAVTVTLGSAFNNLIVFAWTEGTAAQNVTLDMGKAQLEEGSAATECEHEDIELETMICERYDLPVKKVIASSNGAVSNYCVASGSNTIDAEIKFRVPMRIAPTLTISDITTWATATPTAGQIAAYNWTAAGYATITGALTMSSVSSGVAGLTIRANAATSFSSTAGQVVRMQIDPNTTARISARL